MKNIAISTFSAAMIAASAAGAADLGVPAPAAVDYVKVCDAYGEGFFYIPGTETCIKIGGYVRAEYRVYSSDGDFARVYYGSLNPRGTDSPRGDRIGTRARVQLTIDTRTNTEFGLLRSFAETWFTTDTRSNGAPVTDLWKAYIQFGGLTAGRAQSFFDFYLGDHYSSVFETAHSDSQVNLLAYTFSFGNGVSATLSLEDSTTGNVPRRFQIAPLGVYGGQKAPDVVGNINISQAWGSAQVMAAAHYNNSNRRNNDEWGYAVGAGATIKLPMIASGDTFSLQAAYSKGAVSYVTPDPFLATDFIFTGLRSQRQTEAWSVAGGFTHNWTANLSSGVTASYANIDHAARLFDYDQVDFGANLVWAPAAGLTIGAEVEYKGVDFDARFRRDRDAVVGLLRIQRSF